MKITIDESSKHGPSNECLNASKWITTVKCEYNGVKTKLHVTKLNKDKITPGHNIILRCFSYFDVNRKKIN